MINGRIKVNVTGARGAAGSIGEPGTVESNSGFVGPVSIVADDTKKPLVKRSSDGGTSISIALGAPFVSVAGTRTSNAPRLSADGASDANFDSFITSNCIARGDTLFRDEFQSMCDFSSINGAHADFDAFCNFSGAFGMNHARGFQARMKINMTGGNLLAEWTGHFAQPICNGTFDIGELQGFWFRDAQIDSGTQNFYAPIAIRIDDCPNLGNNFMPIRIFSAKTSYMSGGFQFGSSAMLYGGREVRFDALHAKAGIATFEATGGVVVAAPSGGPGLLKAYSNDSGGPRTLAINDNGGQVVFGGTTPLYGKNVEARGTFQASGVYTDAGNGFYNGNDKVVGARGASVANATDAASVITQFNALLDRLRAHGLIAM